MYYDAFLCEGLRGSRRFGTLAWPHIICGGLHQEQVTIDQSIAQRPRFGRPRSQKTQAAVQASALSLLRNTSLRTLTIEEIARDAGVSKATIYRWWDSKIALVIDAFLKTIEQKTPFHGPGKIMTVLRKNVENLAAEYRGLNG